MGLVEKIARLISEQDRIEADEAPDFADWHWEERAGLAKEIIEALKEPGPEVWRRAFPYPTGGHGEAARPSEQAAYAAVINAMLADETMTAPANPKPATGA